MIGPGIKGTLRDAPSGWTCSSSALRFRVDTAGPVSSLTMGAEVTCGRFRRDVTSRRTRGWGFPQPFCNERSVSDAVCMPGAVGACFFSSAHWVFECCSRARPYRDNVAGCQALAGLWHAPKNYRRRASTLQRLLLIYFSKRRGALLFCQLCCWAFRRRPITHAAGRCRTS